MSRQSAHASRPYAGGISISHSLNTSHPLADISGDGRTAHAELLQEQDASQPYRVVVGVTGGIAAYKTPAIVRALRSERCSVQVVPTRAALDMVGITVWEAISGQPVYTDVNQAADEVVHVRTGREADLLIIAPATANTIAKLAAGIADNLLTATALVATCPVLIAPAMHTQMWYHPAVQANIAVLRERGVHIIGPESGRLTGADSGIGRMSEPDAIAARAVEILNSENNVVPQEGSRHDSQRHHVDSAVAVSQIEAGSLRSGLCGCRVLISAGGTREPIDPVRFIGNRSTGRMGIALAIEAARCGASVDFVEANIERSLLELLPASVTVTSTVTAQDMHQRMGELAADADLVIMCAAVGDYRVAAMSDSKIKKDDAALNILKLTPNPDILADLAHHRRKNGQLIVGFAAETGDNKHSVLEYGKEKAQRKGADMIAVNQVSQTTGFGDVNTSIILVNGAGEEVGYAQGSKTQVAEALIKKCAQMLQQ